LQEKRIAGEKACSRKGCVAAIDVQQKDVQKEAVKARKRT
jgi:hypothetical protein